MGHQKLGKIKGLFYRKSADLEKMINIGVYLSNSGN